MKTITGVQEVDAKLQDIEKKLARKAGRKAVNAGLAVLKKQVKAAVPEAETQGHGRKKVQASVGSRNKKNKRANVQEAKVGVGVGPAAKQAVPHAHLIAAGTDERYTGERRRRNRRTGEVRVQETGKQRAYRGRVAPRPFVRRGATVSQSAVKTAMASQLKQELARG